MKVNTDSMILGSWADPGHSKQILDIGTGTGILALMMAQKSVPDAEVTAVELDNDACIQAADNVAASPWGSRMKIIAGDISDVVLPARADCIITNPPYFDAVDHRSQAYSSLTPARAAARMENSLLPQTLMAVVKRQLSDCGMFYCVYPADREGIVTEAARDTGLKLAARLSVRSVPDRPPYLTAFKFTHAQMCTKNALSTEDLVIRETTGEYTSAFRHLCREFYLKF